MARKFRALAGCLALALWGTSSQAADLLVLGEAKLDRPTVHALGVQLTITGDDDRDATVTVRYLKQGQWRDGLPLMRVWPETVSVSVPQQFAGSIFDLDPGTQYEIELHAVDPDGLDEKRTLKGTTRALPPAEPASATAVAVSTAAELTAALAAAKPGHVITLANGTYAGSFFSLNASGSAASPIVIRGASQGGVVIDGQSCTGCNVIEIYGSWVHIERLTIKNAERAIRFQGAATTGNAVRRVTLENVVHGIGSKPDQTDFYVCDNTIDGKLKWPWTFQSDATSHWDDRGVDLTGDGHVICHNLIRGFGDPVVNKKVRARSWDVYGNDIRDCYDGTELDQSEGNARLFGNRWTNVMDPVSIQPIYGGPAYVLRNVVMNAPEEPIKLKSLGGTDEPSGALIFHNSFVSPKLALNLQAPITQHNFRIENNLFVGPDTLTGARTVEWTAKLDGGIFDYNGYYPDGGFWFGVVNGQNQLYTSFADVQAKGQVEQHGVLLSKPIFEAGFVGPADEKTQAAPPDFSLASGSKALDAGKKLAGINSGAAGTGPDLGALELGCPKPVYGPRAEGQEAATNAVDCNGSGAGGVAGGGGAAGAAGAAIGGGGAGGAAASGGTGGSGGAGGGKAKGGGDDGGCGCTTFGSAGSGAYALLIAVLLLGFRRARSSAIARPPPR